MWWEIIVPIVVTLIVAIIAAIITYISINQWYRYQERAPGQPPNWAFALIWTVLYLAFAYAWVRALLTAPSESLKQFVCLLFVISIILNILWVVVFFWFHNTHSALFILVTMIIVGFLLFACLSYDLMSAYLVGIYVLWLLFALALNAFYF